MLTNVPLGWLSPAVSQCPTEPEVSAVLIILPSCSCSILWRYSQTGSWVYPVFASLNTLGIIIFFSASYILSAGIYLLGEKINHWKWGQCFPLAHSPQRYVSLTRSPFSTQTEGKLSPSQKALPGPFVIELRWGLWEVEEEKPGARWHSPGELQVSPLSCQIISHLTQRPNLLSKL